MVPSQPGGSGSLGPENTDQSCRLPLKAGPHAGLRLGEGPALCPPHVPLRPVQSWTRETGAEHGGALCTAGCQAASGGPTTRLTSFQLSTDSAGLRELLIRVDQLKAK